MWGFRRSVGRLGMLVMRASVGIRQRAGCSVRYPLSLAYRLAYRARDILVSTPVCVFALLVAPPSGYLRHLESRSALPYALFVLTLRAGRISATSWFAAAIRTAADTAVRRRAGNTLAGSNISKAPTPDSKPPPALWSCGCRLL